MNIVKRELKANFKSLVIWSLVFVAILFMASTEFEAFRDMANVDEVLGSFPEEFQKAFSFDVVRFDKPEGYYSYMAQFFVLMAAIFASLLGAKILSKEISKKTSETIFTLPVTRRYMISMKLLAALINCFVLTAVIFTASYAIFSQFDLEAAFVKRLALLMLFWFMIEVLFLLMTLFVSVIIQRHKKVGAIMSGVTVAFFMMSFIANMSDKYDFFKYFTPFEYFNGIDVMNGNPLKAVGFIVVPVLIIGFLTASFLLVERKDIL